MSLTGHLNPIEWARVGGVNEMMKIDEKMLTNETIQMIGRDYGLEYNFFNCDKETYLIYIDEIVNILKNQEEYNGKD